MTDVYNSDIVGGHAREFSKDDGQVSFQCKSVIVSKIAGKRVHFAVGTYRDPIQKAHLKGQFYEPEELAIMERYFPRGGTLCDIGSNVGNHSLYLALFKDAKTVVFEPNPDCINLLEANTFLNGLEERIDRRFLGVGVGDVSGLKGDITTPDRNWGGARMELGTGEIPLFTADDLVSERRFDMIKIDVEGMEFKVLKGLEETVKRSRPTIFIEVDNENTADVMSWIDAHNYTIVERFKRYKTNENYLLLPNETIE